MTLSLGALVGDYTVIEHVGAEGTTAEVYRGRDERHDRLVALKLLLGTSERSRREADAVVSLDHPNIVATFDVIENNGQLCLVQEWVDGGTLADKLSLVGQLDLTETLRLGEDVASALAYAHRQGILHRDIKPSNVLLTLDGTYKLVDFGAFGQLQAETSTTRAGEIAGTPLYMSPEQITAAPQSSASDLFGLGLLLYRCLYGRLPDEWAGSYLELAHSRTQTPITVPPSMLQPLLEHCLALDLAQRPRSAAEVLTELHSLRWRAARIPRPLGYAPGPPVGTDRGDDLRGWRPLDPAGSSHVPGFSGDSPVGPDPLDLRSEKKHPDLGWRVISGRPDRKPDLPIAKAPSRELSGKAGNGGRPRPRGRHDLHRMGLPAPVVVGRGDVHLRTPELAPWAALAVFAVAVLVVGIGLLGGGNGLVRIGVGLAITGVGFSVAQQIRRRWTSRAPEAERKAATILFGAGQRDELTRSLMIEVDQVVEKLNSYDAKFLGLTVVAMIREYEKARRSSERQAALLNVVALMEKLRRASPPGTSVTRMRSPPASL